MLNTTHWPQSRQKAKDWISAGELDAASLSRLALWAAKGENSLQTDLLKDTLIAKLQAQVEKLTNNQPSLRGKTTSTNGENDNKPVTAKDMAARYREAMAKGVPSPA